MSEELTIGEAAVRLGISPSAVRKRIARGLLSARKARGQWIVVLSEQETGQGKQEKDKEERDNQDRKEPDSLGKQEARTGQTGKHERERDKEDKREQERERERDKADQAYRELVEGLKAENAFLKSEIESWKQQAFRSDSILQTLAQGLPQLTAPTEEPEPQKRPATVATAMPARRWWEVWRR